MSTRSGARGRTSRALRLSLCRAGLVTLAVLTLAGALTACGSGAHPAAPLTSAPGAGGAAPAVLGPSGPPSSSPPPAAIHTVMKQFAPLDAKGRLVAAAQQGGSGSCFATSIEVPLSGVYRCLSDNTILDPCFAPAQESSPPAVVCFADPWSSGTLMTLAGTLPSYAPDLTDGDPWAIELGNGARCVAVTGAVPVLGDVALTYRCDNGSVAGLSTAGDGTMSAQYGPSSGPLADVGVATAWRGRSYRF